MPSYNIALIPIHDSDQFINYAQELSRSAKPATYFLSAHKSLPHVTLCHFEAKEDELPKIWEQTCKIKQQTIELTFSTRRNKTYDHPKWGGVNWVSLMPDKMQRLKEIHLEVAKIVKPTNAAYDAYDPHMTLLNSHDSEASNKIHISPIVEPAFKQQFMIALGKSDDMGQLTEIIFSSAISEKTGLLSKACHFQSARSIDKCSSTGESESSEEKMKKI